MPSTLAPPLDDDQRRVVHLAADVSGVVAGAPGSGKTRALVARVRQLVESGLDPDEVLALTPSRQSATALRDTLALEVDRATAGPLARSVTAFAFQLVRAVAVATDGDAPQLLTGGDEDQIIADLLEGDADDESEGARRWPHWLDVSIRATPGFRAELRAFFAECTTLGIDAARLDALAETHGVEVWHAIASFFSEYLDVRAQMRGVHRDAAGLVREAVGILRASGRGLDAVERIRVVVVDDAQELTLGGVELLEALHQRGVAVLAFGDPDVGAGAFRGATPENFARLVASLGHTEILSGRHRGSAWQNTVISRVTERIGAGGVVAHRRPATAEPDGTVRTWTMRSAAEEFDGIARLLRERHIHDGVPWDRCAVIAHDTRQVVALEAELAAREVPTRSTGPGRGLGTHRAVRDLLRLVELAMRDEWTYDDVAAALQGVYGRLDAVELRRLVSALRHSELARDGVAAGRDLLLSAMREPLELDLIDTREARAAAHLARTIGAVRTHWAEGATAHELLWMIWDRSRLERVWGDLARGHGPLAEQAGRDLDAVVSVFQAAKRFVERSLDADPRMFVRSILDSDVAEDRLDAPMDVAAVRVVTPASALGGEFDTVVVAGVQEGVWPNVRARGSLLETWRLVHTTSGDGNAATTLDRRRAAMHDELRLFARALSRASAQVIVTAVDDDDTGPSALFELLPDPEPRTVDHPLSLRGLVARHRRTLTSTAHEATRMHAAAQLALLADAEVAGADSASWFGILPPTSTGPLRDLSREDVRVSPSRVHALEECELNWVIGDLGGDPGGATAGLGTIIHAALENATGVDEASLWREVEARWGELEFEAAWRERAEQTRARDMVRRLHLYLTRFEAAGGRLIGSEPHFEVDLPMEEPGATHGAVLSGYIDRVEVTPEGTVVIVDLKTGKNEPQTDAKVIDNPQLGAYQLAYESGAIPGAEGLPPGGARLLVLRPTSSKDYVTPTQPPFDDERRKIFLARLHHAVTTMRGETFAAPYEEHCRDEHSYGLCRIHTIGAVSAS
ncbi:ATP-dependent helicase [Microbacterium koreense]|uniref:DNA 3'-5' helicase n=1 Tax=Microbacterium koreense TaxID=323761 RepID=A0ABW2ZRR3_9MICO